MKVTPILYKQNIHRMIRQNWFAKGKVKIIPTRAEEILKDKGYEVVDINTYFKPIREKKEFNIIGLYDKDIPKNKSHPDYKLEPCLIFRDDNVLIQGLEQAKVLTNTVEICEGLPESVIQCETKLNLSDEVHSEVKKKIKLSCIFEATQKLLPKRKDPLRPAWVFKREYGITDERRNELLCKNLDTICEQFAEDMNNKSVILDAFFSTPVEAHNKKIQFEVTSELVVTTGKKIKQLAEPESTHDISLPDLHPVHCTVSLNPYHFYVLQNIYPVNAKSRWPYIQTAYLHFNNTQVKNAIREKVTETQIQSRSLLKGFSMAAAQARAFFGNDIGKLPEPVVVPVVQTDGKMFHFAIFQLNTLDLDKNSQVKNILWNSERIPLYSSCEYQKGRPILQEYNRDVIKKLIAFYNIQ